MSAAVLRMMAAKGLTIDDAIEIMEAMESERAPRSKGAERQARYRARNVEPSPSDVTRDVTRDAENPPSPSPPPQTPPPRPHPREDKSPARKGRGGKPSFDDADPVLNRIWAAANQISHDRSGRPETASAIRQALDDGATPEAIEASVRAHCRATNDHAKGLHRIINARLWRDHLAKPDRPPDALDPAFLAEVTRHFHKTGEWKPEWGPRPAPPDRAAA